MFNGNQIVFIGTYNGEYAEYNADNNFFEELKVNWTLVEKIDDILRWPDTADDMFFYKRKPALTSTALTSTALTSTKELKEKGKLDLVRIGRERGIPDEMINEMLENNITKLSFVKLLIKKQLETMDDRPLIKYAREHGVSQEIINMYIDYKITTADFIGEILKIV
jgi:hypothetical protein